MRIEPAVISILLGACGLVCAQTESRADEIEAARTRRETTLKPETPPKAEARIDAIQQSVPYRLLTGDVNGFGIGIGSILPGSGFALGPRYTRTDLLGGRLTFHASVLGAVNESYLGGAGLSLPNLLNGHAFIDFDVLHRNISEMPYYGPGPQSRKTGRSDYRLEDTNVELRPGIRIYRGLRASAIGSYLVNNVGPGHSSQYVSTEQQYGPSVAPGIDRQTNFWRGGGLIEYDWRDRPWNPTSGGRYSAQYMRYLDQSLGAYSFFRLDLGASQYVPLFNQTHVLAVRGSSSLTSTRENQRVPFYLQPALGGPDTLRGYRFNRFYGNNSTMLSGEYRWEASPILDMLAFADAGKVFDRWEQWNFHKLQSDVGFGLRFKTQSSVALRFDTAFSHEGFQIWFRINEAVQSHGR